MFDYDKLTTQQKILFQQTKSKLYEESFVSNAPDMREINDCFSVLDGLGYMDNLPEPEFYGNLCALKSKCGEYDSAQRKKADRRKLNKKAAVRIAVAAALAAIIAVTVCADSSIKINIWSLLGDRTRYIYDENIEPYYDPYSCFVQN